MEELQTFCDVNAFSRTNRRLYHLLHVSGYNHLTDKGILIWAARHGLTKVAQSWLRTQVKYERQIEDQDFQDHDRRGEPNKRTPLHWAAEQGNAELTELLLLHTRLDPNFRIYRCHFWEYPLVLAVKNGHGAVVKVLLTDGRVDPNFELIRDETLLMIAAARGHNDVVQILLADQRIALCAQDHDGASALCYAICKKQETVIQTLLADRRCDLNTSGRFAILVAAECGSESIVRTLLADHRVDPNTLDVHGHSANIGSF